MNILWIYRYNTFSNDCGVYFLKIKRNFRKKTGHEKNLDTRFCSKNFHLKSLFKENLEKTNFDEKAKNDFLKGAKLAYETIIINFAKGN